MQYKGIHWATPLYSHLWLCSLHIQYKSAFLCSCILHLLCAHFSWCLELKSNGGRDFSLFSDIGIFTHSHTSSECREYQHFTIFLVSNENAITGNAHFRPSKTLHYFMSLLLTLYNHLTVFKHPPEKFFHCIWCFSQYLST